MKEFLQQYLRFSKKERIGLALMLICMSVFLYLPEWYKTAPLPYVPDTAMIRLMEASVSTDRWSGSRQRFSRKDPYRQQYGQAYPKQPYSKGAWYRRPYTDYRTYSARPKRMVDINMAGIPDWEALPGIGPVLAARIVKYRDKLGGFQQIEQVGQTYGISDSLYHLLKPFLQIGAAVVQSNAPVDPGLPNANTATRESLVAAGIPEQIARSIIVYRSRYGLFKRLEDLRQIVLINDSLYRVLIEKLRIE